MRCPGSEGDRLREPAIVSVKHSLSVAYVSCALRPNASGVFRVELVVVGRILALALETTNAGCATAVCSFMHIPCLP